MPLFLLLLASLFSSFTFASNFYWTIDGDATSYPSVSSACSATWASSSYVNNSSYSNNGFLLNSAGDKGYCNYLKDGASNTFAIVWRNGNSCPDGATYNSATGNCDSSNKCLALKDTPSGKVAFNSSSDLPSYTISYNGCAVNVTSFRCSYTVPGKSTCTGTGSYTGDELAADTSSSITDCTSVSCVLKDLLPETSDKPCIYSADGSGKTTCSSSNSKSDPGSAQCGTVNGSYVCIESPKATSNSTTVESTKSQVSNSDGTVTETINSTSTVTSCAGLRTCTNSTSTSTTTNVLDSTGAVVSSGSSCTGTSCSSTGTTKPAADSTDDSDQDGSSPSTSSLTVPTKGSFDGQESDWDNKINTAKSDLQAGMNKFKSVFSDVGGINLAAGAKLYCPQPVEVLGAKLSFCVDQYKDSLSWISSAILLLCACVALFIVFG